MGNLPPELSLSTPPKPPLLPRKTTARSTQTSNGQIRLFCPHFPTRQTAESTGEAAERTTEAQKRPVYQPQLTLSVGQANKLPKRRKPAWTPSPKGQKPCSPGVSPKESSRISLKLPYSQASSPRSNTRGKPKELAISLADMEANTRFSMPQCLGDVEADRKSVV